jgi:hypothetical protein
MEGGEQVRFCRHCSRSVYNFSSLGPDEIEALIRANEGRLCGRFYRRRDGTILTRDCPLGLGAARRWLLVQMGSIGGVFAVLFAVIPALGLVTRGDWRDWPLWDREPFRTVADRLGFRPQYTMGMIVRPAPLIPPQAPGGNQNSGGS